MPKISELTNAPNTQGTDTLPGQRGAANTYQYSLDQIANYAATVILPTATVQTTNDTPTSLLELIVDEEEAVTLKGIITSAQDDYSAGAGGDFLVVARRATGGNVTIVGVPEVNIYNEGFGTFTVDADTGDQTIRVQVVGEAGTTYNWSITYYFSVV